MSRLNKARPYVVGIARNVVKVIRYGIRLSVSLLHLPFSMRLLDYIDQFRIKIIISL